MNKKRIDIYFDNFSRENDLTKDGAMKIVPKFISEWRLLYLFLLAIIVAGAVPTLLIFKILALLSGMALLFSWMGIHPVTLVYKDRIEKHQPWEENVQCFYYSDLVCVRELPNNHMRLEFKDNRSISVSEKLFPFFRTCFESEYLNQPLCDNALRLFADVITLRDDVQYQSEGLKSALNYFSDPKFHSNGYPDKLTDMVDYFNEYKLQDSIPEEEDYKYICSSIMAGNSSYEERMTILYHLFACAYASDDMVDEEELVSLAQIASRLYIEKWDFLSLKYRFETKGQAKDRRENTENSKRQERRQSVYSNCLQEACNLLGLKENATLEEVKIAYRTQVKTCHPDTLPPTATEKEKAEATLRFRTLTEAYDFLCAELSAEPIVEAK